MCLEGITLTLYIIRYSFFSRNFYGNCFFDAEKLANSAHIVWATGGALVPADIREHYKTMYL